MAKPRLMVTLGAEIARNPWPRLHQDEHIPLLRQLISSLFRTAPV